MKKIIMGVIVGSITFFAFVIGYQRLINEEKWYDQLTQESYTNKLLSESEDYVDIDESNQNYYRVYQNWIENHVDQPLDVYHITVDDIVGGTIFAPNSSFGYESSTIKLTPGETISFQIDMQNAGLYELFFDYFILNDTKLNPSYTLKINDETQYNEMNNLSLIMQWELEDEVKLDRYGDEVVPDSFLHETWRYEASYDPNYFVVEPLKFYFKEGMNDVELTLNEGYMLLGEMTIGNIYQKPITYSEYTNLHSNQTYATDTIALEAEDYTYESRRIIRSKFMRNPGLAPYSYKKKVLNIVDELANRKPGDAITYLFAVDEPGLYQISLKYLQSSNDELSSARTVLIDGLVPFEELSSYRFDYTMKWANETLGNENGAYYVYLSQGDHTLELRATNHEIASVYHRLSNILQLITEIAREVQVNTGGLTERYRDYKLDIYMPNLINDLNHIVTELNLSKEELINIFGTSKLAIISEINISLDFINDFIDEPNDLPSYKSRFNQGDGSVFGRINTMLPKLIDNPLSLDTLFFHGESFDLPKPNTNIFMRLFEGTRAFLYTFFDPKYNTSSQVDDQTIEIWVRNSRLYIEAMQRMADEQFTSQSGIKVLLSVMPDENKVIMANAAGSSPDAAMGLSVIKPFDFAIRDMIVDLSEMDGFQTLASEFNPNSFIPYIFEDGVYSIPETQDVKLMFYRKDILEFLGVEPPKTWDEVISLIALMQKYNYTFYTPLGNDNAFKTFGETTPFIYQFGGGIYNETGDKTILNKDQSYQAFEFMTDLFSVYNVPITTSNFFQKFRDGTIPIGIGDGNTYIQLKYAAPELAGQWGVALIPGVEVEQDELNCPTDDMLDNGRCIVRWDPTYGVSSVIFNKSDKIDLTWEYFQWWFSQDVQSDFTYRLQTLLGEEFLHMTANIEAFRTSAWPSDTKDYVLEQWKWVRTTGRVPGDYLVERELSNAWNRVVNDAINPRDAIDDAVVIINRELKRKLTEFGYYENGVMVKSYRVPTYENISQWIGGNAS
ncbi:MAG: extracellular solute-binding protein [Acholeplasmataceae bacterium]|jgi:ABC-type glycerol-3-phosphate transport system substrate-binding protein|nr:extracellular solute-binding protein [Acholeplasmataceae bacterium]